MNFRAAAPGTAQSISLGELHEGGDSEGVALPREPNPLLHIKARLQVCVGEATLSVGELMALKENQVLALNRGLDEPVDIVLESSVVARGQLVAVGDRFAVCITELPIKLKT